MTKLNLSCRFDRVLFNNEVCVIQNYKTGNKEPERVEINGQMKVEALLVAVNLQRAGITPKRFVVQIVTMPFGVFEAEFSYTALAQMYEDVTGTLLALQSPDAPLRPSEEACHFCPAILICPAVNQLVVKTRPDPLNNDPDELARKLGKLRIIKEQIEEFEKYCYNGLMEDPPRFTLKGYAIVPGLERREWKGVEEMMAAQQTLESLGIDPVEFSKLKIRTPAAYHKLYAAHFSKKYEDVRESFYQVIDGCIEIKQNKPSLKRVEEA